MEDAESSTNQHTESQAEQEAGMSERPASGQAEAESTQEPSRLGRFGRKALRRVTAVVVIFGLGFAATWLVRVRPLMDRVEQLEQRAEQAESERDQLQQRVDQLEGVEERNQELEQELLEARGHLDLLAVLVDVTSAQLEMAEENPAGATVALEDTGQKLDAMAEKLGEQQVAGIRDRLDLVLDGLDSDIFAAQRDLEVLSNTLVALERDLFGGGN